MNLSVPPPHSQESEMIVLGSMLTSIQSLNIGAEGLDDNDFYFTEHKIIFQVLNNAYRNDKPADVHLIGEELKRQDKLNAIGGLGYLATLMQYAGTSAYIEEYIELVRDKTTLRRLINISQEMIRQVLGNPEDVHGLIDDFQEQILNVEQSASIERSDPKSIGIIRLEKLIEHYQTLPDGIDIGLKTGDDIHDKILLPIGAYSGFAAPTKHGKTQALVNATLIAMEKDPTLEVAFITLEELSYPIQLRFLNRFINKELSKNNRNTLAFFLKNNDAANKFQMFEKSYFDVSARQAFEENLHAFQEFCKKDRLRILDFTSFDGSLSTIESLTKRIEMIKKDNPNVRLIVIDYLQLLGIKNRGKLSRDEILKEVCLQLKDVAAKRGIAIITAAQFNRKIQNEDDMHPSEIGEGGAVERHAALVIGMWNRMFPQFSAGKKLERPLQEEILLNVMLNRHGPAHQKLIAPYDGNIGRIDFDKVVLDKQKNKETPKSAPKKNKGPHPTGGW
jgi:replicative DNA helicase